MNKLIGIGRVLVSIVAVLLGLLIFFLDGLDALEVANALSGVKEFMTLAIILCGVSVGLVVSGILGIAFRKDMSWKGFIPAALCLICCIVGACTLGEIGDGTLITVGSGVFAALYAALTIPGLLSKDK